jgi:rubrerythrin
MHDVTASNLRSAYGGESMAHQRYAVWASKADKDGFPNVARLFRAVSHSEMVHAWNHFVKLRGVPGDALVLAGAGFGLGPTAENLAGAMGGEAYEIAEMYPAFIQLAEWQGEEGAAHSMRNALEAEKTHHALYERSKAAVEGGSDAAIGVLHVCDMCGATMEGDAPDNCPICGAAKENFITFA